MLAEDAASGDFEVEVPLLANPPVSITDSENDRLVELLFRGLTLVSPKEHAAFQQAHLPKVGKRSRIVRLCMRAEHQATWLRYSAALKQVACQRGRNRLAYSAIVIAVAKLYDCEVIDSHNLISWRKVRAVGLLGQGGGSRSSENNSGVVIMKDEPSKSSKAIAAKILPAGAEPPFDKDKLHAIATRPLSSDEFRKRLSKLKSHIESIENKFHFK